MRARKNQRYVDRLVRRHTESVIRPFEILGTHFQVVEANDPVYKVQISKGYETVGDGGEFLVRLNGERFEVDDDHDAKFWIS